MLNNFPTKRSFLLLITLSLAGCQINQHTKPDTPPPAAPTTPTESQIDPDAEPEPEDETPEYRPGAHHVDIATDLDTNPAYFGKFKGKATRQIKRFYNTGRQDCRGYIEPMPALVFDKPGTSEPYTVTAEGDIDILFVEFSDRKILCQRRGQNGKDPVIEIPNAHHRGYKIYGGRSKKHATTDFSLTFENLNQPVSIDWLDNDISTIDIDSDLTAPRFVKINPSLTPTENRSPEHGDDSCSSMPGSFSYAQVPDVRIDLKQPAAITTGIRADIPTHMTLVGPVPEDRRDIPTRCLPSTTETVELAAGTYYIRLGLPTDAEITEKEIQFYAHGAAAALDPLKHFENTPDNLPVQARALSSHYPFLNANLLLTNDTLKHQLFTNAPAALYVVATQDFNLPQSPLLDSDPKLTNTPAAEAEAVKKDELLLLLNDDNLVLAADGTMLPLPLEYLKPAEQADAIVLPTTARQTKTSFKNALLLADESDQGIIDQYTQYKERYDQCVAKTESEKHAADSDHVKRVCGYTRFNNEIRRFEGQLEASRTERRNNELNIVRSRLADLVLVK